MKIEIGISKLIFIITMNTCERQTTEILQLDLCREIINCAALEMIGLKARLH